MDLGGEKRLGVGAGRNGGRGNCGMHCMREEEKKKPEKKSQANIFTKVLGR